MRYCLLCNCVSFTLTDGQVGRAILASCLTGSIMRIMLSDARTRLKQCWQAWAKSWSKWILSTKGNARVSRRPAYRLMMYACMRCSRFYLWNWTCMRAALLGLCSEKCTGSTYIIDQIEYNIHTLCSGIGYEDTPRDARCREGKGARARKEDPRMK